MDLKLTLAADVVEKLQERAHKEGVSVEKLIERLLQQSLTAPTEAEFTASAVRMLERYADLHKRLA